MTTYAGLPDAEDHLMPIYHIAYHGYKRQPTNKEMQERMAMFQAAFAAASFVEEGFLGHYFGPDDGYHDAVCVKFKDLEAYRAHMRAPHGPDQASHLRQNVARIRAFDIITPHEPADTKAKIIELYKERWTLFPDVAKVLREEVDARLPYL
jgi:quinol monooxygenase YgiN